MWMLLATTLPALAGPAEAVVLPSQGVQGTVSVSLSPAEAMTRLADPTWVADVDGGHVTVVITGHEGACTLAAYTAPSTLLTVNYTVRQCPTAHGYKSVLVASDDLQAYESEWTIAPDGTGSLLTYRVQLKPTLPIPVGWMTGTIRGDVLRMLDRFAARFGPGMEKATP
jgi:hypothetical protein